MNEQPDTSTDAALETSPCPCLIFDGPAGCPACQGRGELTAADSERFLGRDRLACPWCTGGQVSRRDESSYRKHPCPACLGSGTMPVRGVDLDRLKWMLPRVSPTWEGSYGIEVYEDSFGSADLSGVRFPAGVFSSCSFAGANFTGASLGPAWFEQCDFTESNLELADVGDAVFTSSAFAPGTEEMLLARGAVILPGERGVAPLGTEQCAYCEGSGCSECDDRGWLPEEEIESRLGNRRVPCLACGGEGASEGGGLASFACPTCLATRWMNAEDLPDFDRDDAELRDHPFEDLDLSYSVLRGCEVPPSTFVSCTFTGTDFTDADLSGCIFLGGDVAETNLELAGSLDGVRLYVDGLTPEQEAACAAKGAVLLEAWEDEEPA